MALTRKEMIRLLESGVSPTRVARLALNTGVLKVPTRSESVDRDKYYAEINQAVSSCHRGSRSGHC